jgi:hypothetical protein
MLWQEQTAIGWKAVEIGRTSVDVQQVMLCLQPREEGKTSCQASPEEGTMPPRSQEMHISCMAAGSVHACMHASNVHHAFMDCWQRLKEEGRNTICDACEGGIVRTQDSLQKVCRPAVGIVCCWDDNEADLDALDSCFLQPQTTVGW